MNWIAPRLFSNNCHSLLYVTEISFNIRFIQIKSSMASDAVRYSASVVDNATDLYSCERQAIVQAPYLVFISDVDLRLFASAA